MYLSLEDVQNIGYFAIVIKSPVGFRNRDCHNAGVYEGVRKRQEYLPTVSWWMMYDFS